MVIPPEQRGCFFALVALVLGAAGLVIWMLALWLGVGRGPATLESLGHAGAEAICETTMRPALKVPSSGKFSYEPKAKWEGGQWVWRASVTAQNSYGTPVQTPFVCTVTGTSADDAVATFTTL